MYLIQYLFILSSKEKIRPYGHIFKYLGEREKEGKRERWLRAVLAYPEHMFHPESTHFPPCLSHGNSLGLIIIIVKNFSLYFSGISI